MFSLVLSGDARHCIVTCLSLPPATQSVGQLELGWGEGGSTECLSAVVTWVSMDLLGLVCPVSQRPCHSTYSWAGTEPHWARPQPGRKWLLQDWPIMAPVSSTAPCQHSTLLLSWSCTLSPPLLLLSHKDHFSWKLRLSYFCQCSFYFSRYFFFFLVLLFLLL